jgi:hypothetical protein
MPFLSDPSARTAAAPGPAPDSAPAAPAVEPGPAPGIAPAAAPAAAPDPAPALAPANLSADQVHQRLLDAAGRLRRAERDLVTWFAEMKRRRLYRQLGYGSMRQYAVTALGFSATRAADFNRLADRLAVLPNVRRAVASGELGYTKARVVAAVASPRTEQRWLAEARTSSRRELEEKSARVRRKAAARRAAALAAPTLLPLAPAGGSGGSGGSGVCGSTGGSGGAAYAHRRDHAEDALAADVPSTVSLRLTATQRARYDALWRRLNRSPNAADVLAGLELLLAAGTSAGASGSDQATCANVSPRGTAASPVQIHIQQCPDCGGVTAAGRALTAAEVAHAWCDAAVSAPGVRNTTTIPPRVRREVLARDDHRCRAPGCDHRRFLEVHHIVPRWRGGGNTAANLVTLCGACHRAWHEHGGDGLPAWLKAPADVAMRRDTVPE